MENISTLPPTTATEQHLCQYWNVESRHCIGLLQQDSNTQTWMVTDLRKLNFAALGTYPRTAVTTRRDGHSTRKCEEKTQTLSSSPQGKSHPIRLFCPQTENFAHLQPGHYYIFAWKSVDTPQAHGYEIELDPVIVPKAVEAQWFVQQLFDDRFKDNSKNADTIINTLDTLKKQLSADDNATYLYELLQNANDYPRPGQRVKVEFHLTAQHLLYLHTGVPFNVRNISAICGINEKEKVANQKSIGYKGIGFKTVFLRNTYVHVQTGDYSFRFDQSAFGMEAQYRRENAPWPLLPIWTEKEEVPSDVRAVFQRKDESFGVRMALRPEHPAFLRDDAAASSLNAAEHEESYANNLLRTFSDSNIILFIPNIEEVRVFIDGEEKCTCLRDAQRWVMHDYVVDIPHTLQTRINDTIQHDSGTRIPEKYMDFAQTRVAFACQRNGNEVTPAVASHLYCYLPTGASWGFPFLLNTDMIPKGDRNDIEHNVRLKGRGTMNFNHEITAIAGAKFFDWLTDLLECGDFDFGSVFALVPRFDDCREKHEIYATFIQRFEAAFRNRLDKDAIIPAAEEGKKLRLQQVVHDTTGLSATGLMSDADFLRFCDATDYLLPHPSLRSSPDFNSFLSNFLPSSQQRVETHHLHRMWQHSDFRSWLSDTTNNHAFLQYLLEKNALTHFLDEDLFLDAHGHLCKASHLFYDVEQSLSRLTSFADLLPHLSVTTRRFFEESTTLSETLRGRWKDTTKKVFRRFSPLDFVTERLSTQKALKDTQQRIAERMASREFFQYVATELTESEAKTLRSSLRKLSFFDARNHQNRQCAGGADAPTSLASFDHSMVFFASPDGQTVCEQAWLRNFAISFLAHDYFLHPTTQEPLSQQVQTAIKQIFTILGVQEFSSKHLLHQFIVLTDKEVERTCHNSIASNIGEDNTAFQQFLDFCLPFETFIPSHALNDLPMPVMLANGEQAWMQGKDRIFFSSSDWTSPTRWADKPWLQLEWLAAINATTTTASLLHRCFGVESFSDDHFFKHVVRHHHKEILQNITGDHDPDGQKNIAFIHYLEANWETAAELFHDYKLRDGLTLLACNGDGSMYDTALDTPHLYRYDSELAATIQQPWWPGESPCMLLQDYNNCPHVLHALGIPVYEVSSFLDKVVMPQLNYIGQQIVLKAPNLAFFQWLMAQRDNLSPKHYTLLREAKLPLLFEGDGYNIEAFYFPDAYGTNIEQAVRSHVEHAHFLSTEYLQSSDTDTSNPELAAEWRTFFEQLDVKSDIFDMLVNSILPHLDTIDNPHLLRLLIDYRGQLEEEFGETDWLEQIQDLRLPTTNGTFLPIEECRIVMCDVEEPFTDLALDNCVHLTRADEQQLIGDLLCYLNDCDDPQQTPNGITNLRRWVEQKLQCYLSLQDQISSQPELHELHLTFIREWAQICHKHKDLRIQPQQYPNILLLDCNGQFRPAKELALGSAYLPAFDFQSLINLDAPDLDDFHLDFVSNEYLVPFETDENTEEIIATPDILKKIFISLGADNNFQQKHLPLLSQRACALHFWCHYLPTLQKDHQRRQQKKDHFTHLLTLITNGEFANIPCIPTAHHVARPDELYWSEDTLRFYSRIPQGETKFPLSSLPNLSLDEDDTIFERLNFKTLLSFPDAIAALHHTQKKEERKQLLTWMLEDYDENDTPQDWDVWLDEYHRDENSLWPNSKNQRVPLHTLYAIDPKDKRLTEWMAQLPHIIHKDALLSGKHFEASCQLVRIPIISHNDFYMEYPGQQEQPELISELCLYALVLSAIEDATQWKSNYRKRCQQLRQTRWFQCSLIRMVHQHNPNIEQHLKKFYHDKDTHQFYFVASINDKHVYATFVETFQEYLAINCDKDIVSNVMDSPLSALEQLNQYNDLMLNDDLRQEITLLLPDYADRLNDGIPADDDTLDGTPFNTNAPASHHTMGSYDPNDTPTTPSKTSHTTPHHPSNSAIDSNEHSATQADQEERDNNSKKRYYTHEEENAYLEEDYDEEDYDEEDYIPHPSHQHPTTYVKEVKKSHLLPSDSVSPDCFDSPLTRKEVHHHHKKGITARRDCARAKAALPPTDEENIKVNPEIASIIGNAIAAEAKGGILHHSPYNWCRFTNGEKSIVAHTGGGKQLIIKDADHLKKIISTDSIIIKLQNCPPSQLFEMTQRINKTLLDSPSESAYTLIRLRDNTRHDNLFAPNLIEENEERA